jgi:topoisomerase IA-like protein
MSWLFGHHVNPEARARVTAALADLDQAHDLELQAAHDLIASARRQRARAQCATREMADRKEERDRIRAERVRSGEISPVTDRLRGMLEEMQRGTR